MKIIQMVLGPVGTNCYLAVNENTKELIVIDPADAPQRIIDRVEQTGAKPEAILLTHGHFDHIGAAEELRRNYDIPILCMEPEAAVLADPQVNLSVRMGDGALSLKPDRLVQDNEELDLAGMKIRAFLTPGHTVGGGCYYIEEAGVLFAGDTLFQGSVGRTDFPGGSMGQIVRSIKEKLLTLPELTKVCPGHGPASRIDWERDYNPYLG